MIEVIVLSKQQEAEDICSFILARTDGKPLPPFTAGAHIDVHLPGGIIRQYSLCNPAGQGRHYQIGVLNDPASRGGSRTMHELVQEGSRLQISAPRNLFPLAGTAKRSLLLAGGIGVTPILCMAETLSRDNADFEMHYCTRSRSRTAFRERLLASSFADQVSFHFDDGDPAQKLDAVGLLADPDPQTHLYVCGPTGFMDFILSTAGEFGWPPERVHREYFSAAPVESAEDHGFEIEIRSTGQVFQVPAELRVIDILEENGIDVPVACEEGVCGTCLTRVLDGEPDHRDVFMTLAEHAANDQFTPCCSRSKSARLVLDL